MKKLYAILLATLVTIGSLSGCSGESSSSSGENTGKESSGSEKVAASDEIQKISDKGTTWTIFKASQTCFGTQIDDWNDTLLFKEMEKRTGVHLDFITPVLGQEFTQFQLLISSGNMPDFVAGINNYTGGGEALIDDGIVVDLAQNLDQLPNFSKQLNASELRGKEVKTDTDKIPGFPSFYENDEESEVFVGVLLRKDLLDAANLEVPVTYDDWYNVLSTFKNDFGITKGLTPGAEMFGQNNMWSSGYDFGYVDYFGTNLPFYQIDGKVRYAPVDDTAAFKEYLQMMTKWYKEGLINPDFQTITDVNAQISNYSSVDSGACITAYSLEPVLESIAVASKKDFDYVCVPIPVLEKGQKTHMYAETGKMDLNQILVTTNCKDKDLALKYWDQYYTKEASLLSCWGVEGETFEYDADGLPQWKDTILKNANYNFTSMRIANLSVGIPGVFERRATKVEQQSIQNDAMYRSNGDNSYRISSNVSLTEDETKVYNACMSDLLTYVQEQCVRYITGAESFDSYDKMIEQIKSMNVDEAIAAYQAALDRYNSR